MLSALVVCSLLTVPNCAAQQAEQEPAKASHDQMDLKSRGLECLARVRDKFRLPSGLYREHLDRSDPAFNWGVGVLMFAMNRAAAVDPSWRKDLRELVESSRRYWNPAGPVAGFDVLPDPKGKDRYYDDNAWMVLALVEASKVLDDPQCLADAERALQFVLSGRDDQLGGGIFWREKAKLSKNTCSNGPAAAACIAVFERTHDPAMILQAKELYSWTKSHLLDASDGLFWDSIKLDGTVDRTKWSYNTALMIQTAAKLSELTGEEQFKREAEQMAAASQARWLRNGRLADEGKFAFLLMKSWEAVPSKEREDALRIAMEWLAKDGRNDDGWYGPRFDQPAKPGYRVALIDQAAAACALLIASQVRR